MGLDCGVARRGGALVPSRAPFEVLVRFLVTASALVLMFQAFQTRYYSVAAAFGALALLYNPVAHIFDFQAVGNAAWWW